MSNFASIIVFMVVAAILIITVSIIIYNRRLDKVTRGELHDTHNPLPEPKTTAGVLYRTILIVIVSISLISIGTMSGLVVSLQNSVRDLQTSNTDISNELYSLRTMLDEQAKLISDYNWDFENIDYDSLEADIIVKAHLKEFADDTEVTLSINGNSIPMEKDAVELGTYCGRFHVSLFDELMNGAVLIKTAGVFTSENIDIAESLTWDFFPFPGISTRFTSERTANGKLKYDGAYTVMFDNDEYHNIKKTGISKVMVTYMTSGRELKTIDITQQALNREEIVLESGLEIDKDLTFRFEITTDSGYKLIQNSVMIHDMAIDPDSIEGARIEDTNGNVVWQETRMY